MFEIGDYVIYKNNGVCEVRDTIYMGNGKEARRYYVLFPVKEKDAKIYTPVDNNSSVMRKIITKNNVMSLIRMIPDIEPLCIEDEKKRESIYKEVIRTCDCRELVSLIKTIWIRNKERHAKGMKSTVIDERYFKKAENNLYSELAIAIGIDQSDVPSYIAEVMGEMQCEGCNTDNTMDDTIENTIGAI